MTIISSGQVFERVFEPTIESVARGGTASLFCYGYTGNVSWNQNFKKLKTGLVIWYMFQPYFRLLNWCHLLPGSGKTHTVLGSSGQEGLYKQVAGACILMVLILAWLVKKAFGNKSLGAWRSASSPVPDPEPHSRFPLEHYNGSLPLPGCWSTVGEAGWQLPTFSRCHSLWTLWRKGETFQYSQVWWIKLRCIKIVPMWRLWSW